MGALSRAYSKKRDLSVPYLTLVCHWQVLLVIPWVQYLTNNHKINKRLYAKFSFKILEPHIIQVLYFTEYKLEKSAPYPPPCPQIMYASNITPFYTHFLSFFFWQKLKIQLQ